MADRGQLAVGTKAMPQPDRMSASTKTTRRIFAALPKIAQATRLVQRVYVWQLLAEGYGLVDPKDNRPRPAYMSLKQALKQAIAANGTPIASSAP